MAGRENGMKMKRKAIVICTDLAGLGVIRALGAMNVPVVGMRCYKTETGYSSRFVERVIHVPDPLEREEEFISCLMGHAGELAGGLLIPCDDSSQAALSRYKHELESCYLVAIPEWDITKKVINKKYTYEIAERLKIPHPQTFTVRSNQDLEMFSDSIGFPCLLKPSEGHKFFRHFRFKMFFMRDREELRNAYEQVREMNVEMMLQEFIPGPDSDGVNYNSYFCDRSPVAEFTAQKLRSAPPVTGSPRVVLSRFIPEVIESGRAMLKEIGFHGYSCMEFKKDSRDGVYKLMEINGRSNLSASLAVRCGMNFPYMIYHHHVFQELIALPAPQQNVYWINLAKDMTHFFISRTKERIPLFEYVKPYFKPVVFADFSWSDPVPFLLQIAKGLRRISSMISHKISRLFPFNREELHG